MSRRAKGAEEATLPANFGVRRCCWCGGPFVRVDEHYWCANSEPCRERQRDFAIAVQTSGGGADEPRYKFLFVPLPRQVEFEECRAPNLLGGGAAGSTKSHIARWSLYRRALRVRNYEALLLRRTWNELESHHFRLMAREAEVFKEHGYNVEFSKTNRTMTFHDTNAVIEGGHMENAADVQKYLSRERDDIGVDEGVTFEPEPLLELSTRARSTKQAIIDDGGARFRVYTNPGGAAAAMLRDLFIEHEPNWDDFPAEFRALYDPVEWHYIPGGIEDNPYLKKDYETRLAVTQPWRYRQLRYNDWDVVAGTFFAEFAKNIHVKDLGDPGEYCEWFCSLDWGYTAPGVMLWWACLPDGVLYIRRELKFSHMLIETFVEKAWEVDEDLGVRREVLRYRVADPALKGPNLNKTNEQGIITGETMDETFARAGMPLIMGKNDRVPGWQRCHELLGDRKEEDPATGEERSLGPTVIIHPSCTYLIRALAAATASKTNPEDIDYADDHPLDSFRYGAMSRPTATRTNKIVPVRSFRAYQQMVREQQRRRGVR